MKTQFRGNCNCYGPPRGPLTRPRSGRFAMNRRFALIQALVSLVALAAVVWWASKQESPHIPTHGDAVAWLLLGVGLYALATLVRAERWHQILEATGVHARRRDVYALTTVGYMGNNVLPARAGEALRVVLLSPRCDGSKRTLLGSVVAERVLDVIALVAIFVVTVYGVLSASEVLPTDRPILAGARALDLDFSMSGALYLVALTNFVAALPAAPGSIGTFDAAGLFAAKALGASSSAAVSYVILLRFVLYVPITIFGLVVLVTRYGGWSRLRSATQLEASRA